VLTLNKIGLYQDLRIRKYINCVSVTTGTNVPVVLGFVPVALVFCTSFPGKNLAKRRLKGVEQTMTFNLYTIHSMATPGS